MGNIKFKAVWKHVFIEIRFSIVSPENNERIFIFYKYRKYIDGMGVTRLHILKKIYLYI